MTVISQIPAQLPELMCPANENNFGRQLAAKLESPVALWSSRIEYIGPADDEAPIHATQQIEKRLRKWILTKPTEPECVLNRDGIALFAIPIRYVRKTWYLTVAFPLSEPSIGEQPAGKAIDGGTPTWLGFPDDHSYSAWRESQDVWAPRQLDRFVSAIHGSLESQSQIASLDAEIQSLSEQLNSTYEEISLLYGVSHNLHISRSDEELANQAANWLLDCIPAKCIAIRLLPLAKDSEVTYDTRTLARFITQGESSVTEEQFVQLIEKLDLHPGGRPFVANRRRTSEPDWQFDDMRQVIVAPLYESDHVFGWIAAFNHIEDHEFGTTEASLIRSLGAILGIHSGNLELYRQQAEFLATVVRALTSAIDAKDPYTCGHSDRVARIAVRLAQELGSDQDMLAQIYMAGLLHDIGKIGISDDVLLKPGALTDEEFNHIKEHPELGFRILKDIKQLSGVLPAVLHHHEEWDGSGYPHGLAGEQIPSIARILAVADAYDAMTSERPYRSGMDEDRVHEIFRKGSGSQWDSSVVAAFFEAAKDIRQIAECEREDLTLDVRKWT